MGPVILETQVTHSDSFIEKVFLFLFFFYFLLCFFLFFIDFLLFIDLFLFYFFFFDLFFLQVQSIGSVQVISVWFSYKIIDCLKSNLPLSIQIHESFDQISPLYSYFIHFSILYFLNFFHIFPIQNFREVSFPMLIEFKLFLSDSKFIRSFERMTLLLYFSDSFLFFLFDQLPNFLFAFFISHVKEITLLKW